MASHHKNKGLVNGKGNAQSSLNLDITGEGNLTGFTVKGGQITDNHGGVWKAVRSTTGPQVHDVRLILKTVTEPALRKKEKDPYPDKKGKVPIPPPDGTLTITLEKSGELDKTVHEDVDYANDDPPP